MTSRVKNPVPSEDSSTPRNPSESQPFAVKRARREEAEESDLGGEIRDRDIPLRDEEDIPPLPSPEEPIVRWE